MAHELGHREAPGAEVAPELLAEEHLDIRLVVNHENEQVHARSPDLIREGEDNPKFGELAGLRIDLYRPTMLLDDDVVTDGQAQPSPFTGSLAAPTIPQRTQAPRNTLLTLSGV